MKKFFSIFLAFVIGGFTGGFISKAYYETADRRHAEQSYLLAALQELVSQPMDRRINFLKQSDLFSDVLEDTNLSNNLNHYYWFSANIDKAKRMGIIEPLSLSHQFNGYFVQIAPDGRITDFGFHKP